MSRDLTEKMTTETLFVSNKEDIKEAVNRARKFVENLDLKHIVYITKRANSLEGSSHLDTEHEEDVICIDYTTNIIPN